MRLPILLLLLMGFVAGVVADEEYPWEEADEAEGSEGFGSAAAWLLFIGLLHPLFKYTAPRLGLDRVKVSEIRRRTIKYHAAVLSIATLLAVIHHFTSELDVLAYPALILMVWLSLTGAIMKFSLHPGTSRYAAMIHFQQIFTAILLISLFLHLAVGAE